MTPQNRREIGLYVEETGVLGTLAEDVRRGLTKAAKELPPKYFYDAKGSELFERICETPEYYPTRTERAILRRIAAPIVEESRPTVLVEFGPGSASKTRLFLDAMAHAHLLNLYVPIDVSKEMLRQVIVTLGQDYPGLRIQGIVGDFERPVERVPNEGRRLAIFLGSTIGNLTPVEATAFLKNVACLLAPHDRFLLGTDLVKDVGMLERAYNDAAGVTAAFNLNILSVINQHLGADFDLNRFDHRAFYNAKEKRIEMHLVARETHQVWIEAIDLAVDFAKGESIRTEISCKYTRPTVETMLEEAGLRLLRWETDDQNLFSLSLSQIKS